MLLLSCPSNCQHSISFFFEHDKSKREGEVGALNFFSCSEEYYTFPSRHIACMFVL